MTLDDPINAFLAASPFAVVGASRNRARYGNKVLRCYVQNDLSVTPVNPGTPQVEGLTCYPSLSDIPTPPSAVSVITPPQVTLTVVEEAAAIGVSHIWMQPGAESDEAVTRAQELGLNTIAGGPCILVALGYHD